MKKDGYLLKNILKEIEVSKLLKKNSRDYSSVPESYFLDTLEERVATLMKLPLLKERIGVLKGDISRIELAILIVKEFLKEKFGKFSDIELINKAVKTGLAILTEGTVSAPIDGITRIEESLNDDGSTYLNLFYSGPIRGAGGTAQIFTVLFCEYIRKKLNYSKFKIRPNEVDRAVSEVLRYSRIYPRPHNPSVSQIKLILEMCPVCINGDGTQIIEVTNHKYLERVNTPRIRGGMCLVLSDGFIAKAKKILRYLKVLDLMEWEPWIQKILDLKKSFESFLKEPDPDPALDSKKIIPLPNFARGLIVGRPVLSMKDSKGCFRLRLGRSRNTGLGTVGIHPMAFKIIKFCNVGTQIMVSHPGKAGSFAPVSSLDAPTVILQDGETKIINTTLEYENCEDKIIKVADPGEILINYGDFLENNCKIPVLDYCKEEWVLDLKKRKLYNRYTKILKTPESVWAFSKEHNLLLDPEYIFITEFISKEEYLIIVKYFKGDDIPIALIKKSLENGAIPHKFKHNGDLIIKNKYILEKLFAAPDNIDITKFSKISDIINSYSEVKIKQKGSNTIGFRIGRSESAGVATLKPKTHGILDVKGYVLGSQNKLQKVLLKKKGLLKEEVYFFKCPKCSKIDYESVCVDCNIRNFQVGFCDTCNKDLKIIDVHKSICNICNTQLVLKKTFFIDLVKKYYQTLKKLKHTPNKPICVSNNKLRYNFIEPLDKIILRGKHDISIFKDGTSRYNVSNITLTHFKPREINTPVEKLIEMGYIEDIYKIPLVNDNQILELKLQDVICNYKCLDHFYKVTKFIDELIEKYYGGTKYYDLNRKNDLIGLLFIGLAPHTCKGTIIRLIGTTKSNVIFGHPVFHASKRRNCDGDQDSIMLLLDVLLNHSVSYIRESRGSTMNLPVFISTKIIIAEVDGEAHNVDIVKDYPLEIYRLKEPISPKDCPIKTIGSCNEDLKNTLYNIETERIDLPNNNNYYKTCNIMAQKLEEEIKVMQKLRGINVSKVLEEILNSHILPDLIGNTRTYLKQGFKCMICKKKYRVPPLIGCCIFCKGSLKLNLYPNSVKKYLKLSEKFLEYKNITHYTKQKVLRAKSSIELLFPQENKRTLLKFFRII